MGGGLTNYSTDEQVIDTWIDGKPIYSRTVIITAMPNDTTSIEFLPIQDVDMLFYHLIVVNQGTAINPIWNPHVNICWVQDNKIAYMSMQNDDRGKPAYAILTYTKT